MSAIKLILEVAYKILKDRCSDDGLILRTLENNLVHFKPVKVESVAQLHALHSVFKEMIQSINGLERNGGNDMWYILLVDKKDPVSEKEWEVRNPGSECLELEKLWNFLDNRVHSIESVANKDCRTSSP